MSWSELDFGKHEGKTLPQVLFSDPDWFFWAMKEGVFKKRPLLRKEAELIHSRATNIKIRQDGPEELVAEYYLHHPTNKFSHFEIVPESRPAHTGSSQTFRFPKIDMSFPTSISSYDKLGCKLLLGSLKHHVWGDAKTRMTKSRCEEFFSDPNNFLVA